MTTLVIAIVALVIGLGAGVILASRIKATIQTAEANIRADAAAGEMALHARLKEIQTALKGKKK